jgi:hypothetical protein
LVDRFFASAFRCEGAMASAQNEDFFVEAARPGSADAVSQAEASALAKAVLAEHEQATSKSTSLPQPVQSVVLSRHTPSSSTTSGSTQPTSSSASASAAAAAAPTGTGAARFSGWTPAPAITPPSAQPVTSSSPSLGPKSGEVLAHTRMTHAATLRHNAVHSRIPRTHASPHIPHTTTDADDSAPVPTAAPLALSSSSSFAYQSTLPVASRTLTLDGLLPPAPAPLPAAPDLRPAAIIQATAASGAAAHSRQRNTSLSHSLPAHKPRRSEREPHAQAQAQQQRWVLDGYRMLEASGLQVPEDVARVVLSCAEPPLTHIITPHLAEFVHLTYLDVSGNRSVQRALSAHHSVV